MRDPRQWDYDPDRAHRPRWILRGVVLACSGSCQWECCPRGINVVNMRRMIDLGNLFVGRYDVDASYICSKVQNVSRSRLNFVRPVKGSLSDPVTTFDEMVVTVYLLRFSAGHGGDGGFRRQVIGGNWLIQYANRVGWYGGNRGISVSTGALKQSGLTCTLLRLSPASHFPRLFKAGRAQTPVLNPSVLFSTLGLSFSLCKSRILFSVIGWTVSGHSIQATSTRILRLYMTGGQGHSFSTVPPQRPRSAKDDLPVI